jgi:phosphate transport system permease protein
MMSSKEVLAKSVFLCSAISSAVIILAILGFMVALGIPLFRESTFSAIWAGPWAPHRGAYGIWAMISGTFWIALLATIICLPLSLGMSFVISSLGGGRIRKILGALVQFMTGIPTVIYGFVGIFLLVPFIRQGFGGPGMCVLTASIMLAILISPTMILFFTDSLLAVNAAYVQAAKALGANRVQRLLYVMVPRALGGMASGFILAMGRALGDTLIALMLAGNAIRAPQGFLEPARTLTAHIALVKAADFDSMEFRSIFACGITLYLFTILATIAVRMMARERVAVS